MIRYSDHKSQNLSAHWAAKGKLPYTTVYVCCMAELERNLGLIDATLLGIGAIIGAGIYVVIGIAAGLAGPSVVLSIILAGIAAGLSSLSFSELGAAMPREGGPYEFTRKVISPFIGFMTGWLWLSANIVTGAAVSLGFAGYLVSIFPFSPSNWLLSQRY